MQSNNLTPSSTNIITSIWYYFTSTPVLLKPPEQPVVQSVKKRRAKTSFDANQTAAIALPEKPKKDDGCVTKTTATSTSYITGILNSVITHFIKSTASQDSQTNNPSKKFTIKEQMIILEKKKEGLTDLAALDDINLEQVELVAAEIIEHASRRVDLFFLLLVAVYEKDVIVSKGDTLKQHGSGSDGAGTQACHSSLLPNIKMELKPKPPSWFSSTPICPSLAGTHAEGALNMTVELPSIVNDFDGHLEGRSNKKNPTKFLWSFLEIVNYVSGATYDPQRGMNQFLKIMSQFFLHFEENYINKNKAKYPKTMKKILELEKEGTYSGISNDKQTINDEYLYSQLRLTRSEIFMIKMPFKSFYNYYKRNQNEIYASKPVKEEEIERKKVRVLRN